MGFQDKKFAQQYESRLSAEGYPGNLLDEILTVLQGVKSIIDIGAGTGFFSVPLLERGFTITAIEPSAEMINLFSKKIPKNISNKISIHNQNWESWEGDKAEALICIHSIYNIKNTGDALQKMARYAGRRILLFRADSGSHTLSGIIRRQLGRSRCSTGFSEKIITSLKQLGYTYSTRKIEQQRDSFFESVRLEAEYYCYHLGLEKEKQKLVEEIISNNATPAGKGFVFKSIYRDCLLVF